MGHMLAQAVIFCSSVIAVEENEKTTQQLVLRLGYERVLLKVSTYLMLNCSSSCLEGGARGMRSHSPGPDN